MEREQAKPRADRQGVFHVMQLFEQDQELEGRSSEEILSWAVRQFPGRLVLSASFGGPTSLVVLDQLMAIDRSVPVSYIDTGLLFPETYELIAAVERRYGIAVQAVRSDVTLAKQAAAYGDALWSRDPDACCSIRKVAPQSTYLANFDAWITGLRRDQGASRKEVKVIEWDRNFGLAKLNPLASWDASRVWSYVLEHDLPYNPLNDRGYPSVGCTHCTRAIGAGEDPRAGRWAGTGKTECGLHVVSAGEAI
jgi:phosphoadenosine phosphosulfate reductase